MTDRIYIHNLTLSGPTDEHLKEIVMSAISDAVADLKAHYEARVESAHAAGVAEGAAAAQAQITDLTSQVMTLTAEAASDLSAVQAADPGAPDPAAAPAA